MAEAISTPYFGQGINVHNPESKKKHDDVGLVFEDTYVRDLSVGSSIGLSTSETVSGSLGFYLRFDRPGAMPRYFAVTCHHVLSGKCGPTSPKTRIIPLWEAMLIRSLA